MSPAHYCVRILEQQTDNGNITKEYKDSNNYAIFLLEFSLYFNNINNHQIHWPAQIGDLCAIKDLDTYYRAKVIEIRGK